MTPCASRNSIACDAKRVTTVIRHSATYAHTRAAGACLAWARDWLTTTMNAAPEAPDRTLAATASRKAPREDRSR